MNQTSKAFIHFEENKAGFPIAYLNEKRLHSYYNPLKEAQRFILNQENIGDQTCLILLETGLGYVYHVIKKLYPRNKLILIVLNDDCYEKSPFSYDDTHVIYSTPANLRSFLIGQLVDTNVLDFKIIDWPTYTRLREEEVEIIQSNILETLKLLRQNLYTSKIFGRLWFKNTIRNILTRSEYYRLKPNIEPKPIAIIASGTTLEKSLSWLKKNGNRIHILALPSALEALKTHGIPCDFLISTDAGYWAKRHLDPLANTNHKPWIISPLLAGIPSHIQKQVPFATSNQIDKLVIQALGWKIPFIAEKGTVMATALEWAKGQNYSPVITFGFDLCFEDWRSHVNPSTTFNTLLLRQNKLQPLSNQFLDFKLQYDQNEGMSPMNVYASWFNQQITWPEQYYRYHPSKVQLKNFKEISKLDDLEKLLPIYPKKKILGQRLKEDDLEWRSYVTRASLKHWLASSLWEKQRELMYFLAPDTFMKIFSKTQNKKTGQESLIEKATCETKQYLQQINQRVISLFHENKF